MAIDLLTDDEIIAIRKSQPQADFSRPWGDSIAFARAIEARLREGQVTWKRGNADEFLRDIGADPGQAQQSQAPDVRDCVICWKDGYDAGKADADETLTRERDELLRRVDDIAADAEAELKQVYGHAEDVTRERDEARRDAERMRWWHANIDALLDDEEGVAGLAFSFQIPLADIARLSVAELMNEIADRGMADDAALSSLTPGGEG